MSLPITEYDETILTLELADVDNPADLVDEIKIDLLTDLMAGGDTYSPPAGRNRPSPPGSRYSEGA